MGVKVNVKGVNLALKMDTSGRRGSEDSVDANAYLVSTSTALLSCALFPSFFYLSSQICLFVIARSHDGVDPMGSKGVQIRSLCSPFPPFSRFLRLILIIDLLTSTAPGSFALHQDHAQYMSYRVSAIRRAKLPTLPITFPNPIHVSLT